MWEHAASGTKPPCGISPQVGVEEEGLAVGVMVAGASRVERFGLYPWSPLGLVIPYPRRSIEFMPRERPGSPLNLLPRS